MNHVYIEIIEKNPKQLCLTLDGKLLFCSLKVQKKEVKQHKAELSKYVLDTKCVNGKHHLLLGS